MARKKARQPKMPKRRLTDLFDQIDEVELGGKSWVRAHAVDRTYYVRLTGIEDCRCIGEIEGMDAEMQRLWTMTCGECGGTGRRAQVQIVESLDTAGPGGDEIEL